LPYLLYKTERDLPIALQYAHDYNFGDDFVYFNYIKQAMLICDSILKEKIEDHQGQISAVSSQVANKDALCVFLERDCVPKLSNYDYEGL
jgi:hypothetical protein